MGITWFGGCKIESLKRTQGLSIEARTRTMDKEIVVKLEGVVVGYFSMHKPKTILQGLTMVANCGRKPTSFTKKKVYRVEDLHELKKVELIVVKSFITNVLQQKFNLEAKVKRFCSQMEDKNVSYVETKMGLWRLQWASFQPITHM